MFYVKDNSPTIGFINDTIGICGTIWGTIYSAYSTPVSQRMFKINYPFETNSVGEYSTRVFSKPSYLYYLSYYINPYTTQYALITPISYTMEPDSVIERDIYLLDTLITGLKNPAFSIPLKVYPNPLAVNSKLIIEIDLPVLTSVFWIILTSQDGKLLHKEKAEAVKTLLNMPAVSGVYLLTVIFDNRTISSTKVVVNNE